MQCTQVLKNVSAKQSARLIGGLQSWDWTGH